MKDMLFVLGAPDPEMQAIEGLLKECGVAYAYAVDPEDQRVHPGNAYKAENFIAPPEAELPETLDDWEIVEVECAVRPRVPGVAYTTIDHHRPGDPGYGRPPSEFLAASSIGQVVTELARLDLWPPPGDDCVRDWTPTNCRPMWLGESYEDPHGVGGWWIVGEDSVGCCHRLPYAAVDQDLILAAAADHCLAAAYRGECPGVDPDELMKWRAETRAAHQGRSVNDVLADVEAARTVLRESRTEAGYADLRGRSIPELPEAAAREGIPFIATVKDRDGREKVVLQAAPVPLVQRFLAGELIPGLVEYYGDPARGFAGGYTTPAEV